MFDHAVLTKAKWGKVNAWRPIRGEVLDAPLALADARTLGKEAKVVHKIIYRDR